MNVVFQTRYKASLVKSPVCIGLDTDIRLIPEFLQSELNPLFEFNKQIIDATIDLAGAYKPNFAFYEAHGVQGWDALYATVNYIRQKGGDCITIADAKRGDIGNTAKMYAQSIFDDLGFDSVTVNPFMGSDAVEPFLERETCGAFILCLTSNSGAMDFQFMEGGGEYLFEKVAKKITSWNRLGNAGLVVGATRGEDMYRVREIAGDAPFLIPGIGAQGGDLYAAVRTNYRDGKHLAFINSSRSIIYASGGKDFAEAAREATLELKRQIELVMA